MVEHISFTTLVDLVEGRRAFDQHLRAHIAACPACAADLAWLEQIIALMRGDQLPAAPPDLLAHAKALFRAHALDQPARTRRRLIAVLNFDSARSPAAPGMRAGVLATRQMLFSVEEYSVDVRIARNGTLWAVSGQLLGLDNARSVALHGSQGTICGALDNLSGFSLPPVPAGTYTLTLHLDDLDIEIPALEVGS